MADYSNTKKRITSNFPSRSAPDGAGGISRAEPFLTPERLKNEFLFGVPLRSPLTGQTMSDDMLKELIKKSAAEVEMECKIDIFLTQRKARLEFDRTKNQQGWGQLNLGFANLYSLEEVSIRTVNSTSTQNPNPGTQNADGVLIYSLSLEWIDIDTTGHKGVIYVVPLQTAYTGMGQTGSYNGAAASILTMMNQINWMPGFWYARFTTGFDQNAVPATINTLIGNKAALKVLSMLGPVQKYSSKSIGVDGTSQSLAGPGYQLFALRIADLKEAIASDTNLIKRYFGNYIYMTHV